MKNTKAEIVIDLLVKYIFNEQRQTKGDKHVYYSKWKFEKFK